MSILDDRTAYDPTAMPNSIPAGVTDTRLTSLDPAKPVSSGPSKKDVKDLAASFEPVKPEAPTPAEKERKRRLDVWAKNVETLAKELLGHQAADGDVQATHRALTALKTVANQGAKAIEALKDGQLISAEPKAARAPKAAKVDEIASTDEVTVHPSEAAATAAVEASPQTEPADDGNTGF